MTLELAVAPAILTISAAIASILVVAWLDFGRPRHALTWAITFALVAVMLAAVLAVRYQLCPIGPAQAVMVAIGCAAGAVNLIGFRQRAGLPSRAAVLLLASVVPLVIGNGLLRLGSSGVIALVPIDLWNATTFLLAARTLIGRRRSEWAAERLAGVGLVTLALLSIGAAVAKATIVFGLKQHWLEDFGLIVLPLLPAAVTASGLFVIFLLTADLADETRRMAQTDSLTGLLNRRGFQEAGEGLLRHACANDLPVTLVLIDLDRFKHVNDSFGHLVGDAVLVRFARELAERVSRRDPLARLGGEEFALLMARADLATATRAAELLREAIAGGNYELPDGRIITASFGLATLRPDGATLDDLLRRADKALYAAKARGRNRVVTETQGRPCRPDPEPAAVRGPDAIGTAAR